MRLPLTPLTALYCWSAGSSFGGPDANATAAVSPTSARAAHVFVLIRFSFPFVRVSSWLTSVSAT